VFFEPGHHIGIEAKCNWLLDRPVQTGLASVQPSFGQGFRDVVRIDLIV